MTTEDPMIDIASLRDLCERATAAPWIQCNAPDTNEPSGIADRDSEYIARCDVVSIHSTETCIANAAFIAAARSALPAAIAEIERLRGLVARWEALGDRHELALRDLDCKCYQEIGDSPCPVHPNPDEVGK